MKGEKNIPIDFFHIPVTHNEMGNSRSLFLWEKLGPIRSHVSGDQGDHGNKSRKNPLPSCTAMHSWQFHYGVMGYIPILALKELIWASEAN